MIIRSIISGLLVMVFFNATVFAQPVHTDLGTWSDDRLNKLISETRSIDEPGEQIVTISSRFVGTPYATNTLIGGPDQSEQLVIDLAAFDCFTLLDTVEALRRSVSFAEFPERLQQVRYKQGIVSFPTRNHFFSDWVSQAESPIVDATHQVAPDLGRVQIKQLNRRADGSPWIPGVKVVTREITYIPSAEIDREVLASLQPGDYVGIYSDSGGLDVSHVGIIVITDQGVMLRHASSRPETGRVVDEELVGFLRDKPGLVIYRVKE